MEPILKNWGGQTMFYHSNFELLGSQRTRAGNPDTSSPAHVCVPVWRLYGYRDVMWHTPHVHGEGERKWEAEREREGEREGEREREREPSLAHEIRCRKV